MTKKGKSIQSRKEGNLYWQESTVELTTNQADTLPTISVDTSSTYQTWLGFGGAITEAAAYNLTKIAPENKKAIIDAYYNRSTGLGYTLGRVHINSCDFSLGNYDYVEEKDETLASFSIDHEEKYVLPLLREIESVKGEPLQLLASPWSPPAWMKTNEEMNNGGKLKEVFYPLWAQYMVKYIHAMKKKGFSIWAITIQNEPAAQQVWDSCLYSPEEERDFIKNHLGPLLEKEKLDNVKVVIWDHNRDIIVERVQPILSDPDAAKYVWGTGNHWYVSEEFENLSKVHEQFPDKHLLFTEGCIEGGVQLGAWHTGERYARNIIGDINNWLEGFIDWNIVLDEQGGPNHVGNYCDAPIIVNTKTDEVHYNSSYYFIGHFSKYIRVGAKKIDVKTTTEKLAATAFVNPDQSVVIVVLNEEEELQNITLSLDGDSVSLEIPSHSITTYVFS